MIVDNMDLKEKVEDTGACEENAPKKEKKCSKKDKGAELLSKITEIILSSLEQTDDLPG